MVLNSNHTYFFFSPWSCSSLIFCSECTFPPASICSTMALEGLHFPYFYNQLRGGHLPQNVCIYFLFFPSLLLYSLKRLWKVDPCNFFTLQNTSSFYIGINNLWYMWHCSVNGYKGMTSQECFEKIEICSVIIKFNFKKEIVLFEYNIHISFGIFL